MQVLQAPLQRVPIDVAPGQDDRDPLPRQFLPQPDQPDCAGALGEIVGGLKQEPRSGCLTVLVWRGRRLSSPTPPAGKEDPRTRPEGAPAPRVQPLAR